MKKWQWVTLSTILTLVFGCWLAQGQISQPGVVPWYSATPPTVCAAATPIFVIAPGFTGAGNLYGNTSTTTGTSCSQLNSGGSGTFNALTGDATSTSTGGATTVKGINSTLLSSLATGILKNTTTTGVPSIAVAADFPTLNQSTTGNAATANGFSVVATQSGTNVASLTLPSLTLTPGKNYQLIIHITSTSFTSGTPGFIGLQFCTTDPTCASAVTTGYNGAGGFQGLSGSYATWGAWNSAPAFCVYPVTVSAGTCKTDSFATTYSNALSFFVTFQDPGNTSSNKTATVQGVYSDSSALFTSVTGGYYWSNSAGTLPAVTGMTLVSYVGGSPGGTMTVTMTLVNTN